MEKLFQILKDIAIIIVLLSISYIVFNWNSIIDYWKVFISSKEIISNNNYNNTKIKPVLLKDLDKTKPLFLYNNYKEAKRSKENNNYEWKDFVNKSLFYLNYILKVDNTNNHKIEEELKKKRLKMLKENKTFSSSKNNTKVISKDDFFSLSDNLTPEETKKYGKKSYVVIPKLKIEAPIFYPSIEEKHLEKKILEILKKWVVHRPETQLPYQKWNFFILWHSSNYAWIHSKYNNIFSKIDLLNLWDKIFIYYKWRKYTYTLSEKKIVDPSAIEVYWYLPWYNLSIMTCFPIGSTKSRLIAIAKLEKK